MMFLTIWVNLLQSASQNRLRILSIIGKKSYNSQQAPLFYILLYFHHCNKQNILIDYVQ